MYPRMRYLLDKNVIRDHLQGLIHLAREETPQEMEIQASIFVSQAQQREGQLFISLTSYHILLRLCHYQEVQVFLRSVSVLYSGKYCKRWARRLRGMGFTREDAHLVSLGSFGIGAERAVLGVHAIATFDQLLITKYALDLPTLQARLEAMTTSLNPPFCYATLPDVKRPTELI